MEENFVLHVIFDTCDVMYNRSISLLPPIVLDKLFEGDKLMHDTWILEVHCTM